MPMAILEATNTKVRKLNYAKRVEVDEEHVYVYDCYSNGSQVLTFIRPLEQEAEMRRYAQHFNNNFSELVRFVSDRKFVRPTWLENDTTTQE